MIIAGILKASVLVKLPVIDTCILIIEHIKRS